MQSIYLSDPGERKRCCGMQKLAPLKEALPQAGWWIVDTGRLVNRSAMDMVEQAPEWGLRKFHPVLDWEEAMVDAALAAQVGQPLVRHGIPEHWVCTVHSAGVAG